MSSRPQLFRRLFLSVSVVLHVAIAAEFPISSQVFADEETPAIEATSADTLPRSGVLEVVITNDGKPITIKSISRAQSKLEAILKAQARQPESARPLLVAINVNETTREFSDITDAIRVVKGVSEIVDAANKAKIRLGEVGRLDFTPSPSQQSQTPASEPTVSNQQARSPSARDGDDGFGVGGGLGGQGGGGAGIANGRRALAGFRGSGAGAREAQIAWLRQRLIQLLAAQQQSEPASSSDTAELAPKEVELSEATLFSRMVHRDYQKATFSFEFGLRDDPTYLHNNDWDLQYGSGGDHFHVTMVSDDRSRIVDLGKMDWEQLDTTRLAKLPPHPRPRREFVATALGHIYVVHTVDRNTDLYALFRVKAIDQKLGSCDITWRLVDAPK